MARAIYEPPAPRRISSHSPPPQPSLSLPTVTRSKTSSLLRRRVVSERAQRCRPTQRAHETDASANDEDSEEKPGRRGGEALGNGTQPHKRRRATQGKLCERNSRNNEKEAKRTNTHGERSPALTNEAHANGEAALRNLHQRGPRVKEKAQSSAHSAYAIDIIAVAAVVRGGQEGHSRSRR